MKGNFNTFQKVALEKHLKTREDSTTDKTISPKGFSKDEEKQT